MIKLNEEYGLKWDGYSYALYKYDEGGKPINYRGENRLTKPGWKSEDKYFSKIEHAVRYVANEYAANSENLQDFLDTFQKTVDAIQINVSK